jgi:putative transposase
MPWLETSPMDQRMQFIVDYERGLQSVTELADRFSISRKTAYKWIDRHEADEATGWRIAAAARDRARTPHRRRWSMPCSRCADITRAGARKSCCVC